MPDSDVLDGFTSNKPYLFRALYEWILDNNATPYVLVDANLPNVVVPTEHIKDGQIVLNICPGAIQNWFVDNSAVSFSARFSGKALSIHFPMQAVLAIYAQENGMGMSFPKESGAMITEGTKAREDNTAVKNDGEAYKVKKEAVASKKKSFHLKVVK